MSSGARSRFEVSAEGGIRLHGCFSCLRVVKAQHVACLVGDGVADVDRASGAAWGVGEGGKLGVKLHVRVTQGAASGHGGGGDGQGGARGGPVFVEESDDVDAILAVVALDGGQAAVGEGKFGARGLVPHLHSLGDGRRRSWGTLSRLGRGSGRRCPGRRCCKRRSGSPKTPASCPPRAGS